MPGVRGVLQRLKGVRHIEWILLAMAAAAAALLLTGKVPEGSAGRTALEGRMESVLSCVAGAGKVRVLVHSGEAVSAFAQEAERAEGVIVVAEGAGSLRVAMELEAAVQALLGVDAGQIEILPMKGEEP